VPPPLSNSRWRASIWSNIHGQLEHYSLLKSGEQRRLLDAYAGATPLAGEVAGSFRAWRDARALRENGESHAGEQEAEARTSDLDGERTHALAFTPEGWAASRVRTPPPGSSAADLLAGGPRPPPCCSMMNGDCVLTRLPRRARPGWWSWPASIPPSAGYLGMLESAAETLHETARELTRYAEGASISIHKPLLTPKRGMCRRAGRPPQVSVLRPERHAGNHPRRGRPRNLIREPGRDRRPGKP